MMRSQTGFETRALLPRFGAEVIGVQFAHPMASATVEEIRRLADLHGILLFRNTGAVSDADQLEFCRQLGPGGILGERTEVVSGTRLAPGVTAVGNIGDDGSILPLDSRRRAFMRGNELWHTDSSFSPNRGVYSVLKAVELPPHGAAPTEYADMRGAFRDLPEQLRERVKVLTALHSLSHSRERAGYRTDESEQRKYPPTSQPLVVTNPRTGTSSLYLASHISRIEGLDEADSAALLEELFMLATAPHNVYRHAWAIGDIVLWDNLTTMHRATSFDDNRWRRDMHRVTTLERVGTS